MFIFIDDSRVGIVASTNSDVSQEEVSTEQPTKLQERWRILKQFRVLLDISGTVKDDAPDYGEMIEKDTLENGQRLTIEDGPETDEVTDW